MTKINLDGRKYLTPREVEEIFGIKSATLRRQRWGDYGMPYHKHNITNKILYCIEDIENSLKKITPTQKGKKNDK